MASDRFQMINTLFHAMIDGIIIQLFWFSMKNCWFFLSILPLDFACLLSTDEVRLYIFASSMHPFVHSVRLSALLSVQNHISVLICHIRIILCTNDMYHVLSISHKFRQNRPLSTWVMALVLVKAFIMQNLYQLFCMMIFTFHQSYYILQLLTIDHKSSVHVA